MQPRMPELRMSQSNGGLRVSDHAGRIDTQAPRFVSYGKGSEGSPERSVTTARPEKVLQ